MVYPATQTMTTSGILSLEYNKRFKIQATEPAPTVVATTRDPRSLGVQGWLILLIRAPGQRPVTVPTSHRWAWPGNP